jgi:hypothetical protein
VLLLVLVLVMLPHEVYAREEDARVGPLVGLERQLVLLLLAQRLAPEHTLTHAHTRCIHTRTHAQTQKRIKQEEGRDSDEKNLSPSSMA